MREWARAGWVMGAVVGLGWSLTGGQPAEAQTIRGVLERLKQAARAADSAAAARAAQDSAGSSNVGGESNASAQRGPRTARVPGIQNVALTPSAWMVTGTGAVRAAGWGTFACDVIQIDASEFTDGGRVVVGVHLGDGASAASFSLYPGDVTVVPPAKRPDRALDAAQDVPPGWVGGLSHQFGPSGVRTYQLCAEGNWGSPVDARNTYAYRVAVDPVDGMANISSPRSRLDMTGPAARDTIGRVELTPANRTARGTRPLRASGWYSFSCDLIEIDTRAFVGGGRLMVGLQLADGESSATFSLYPEQVTVASPSKRPDRALDVVQDVPPGWVGGLSHEFGPRRAQTYQLCAEGNWGSRVGATNRYTYQITVEPAPPNRSGR